MGNKSKKSDKFQNYFSQASNFGLIPIDVTERWGFVFLNFSGNADTSSLDNVFQPVFEDLKKFGSYEDLTFVRRVDYK